MKVGDNDKQRLEQNLFWVHKNPQSKTLGRSGDTETHHILSHVRNRRQKHKPRDQAWTAYASCLEVNAGSSEDALTAPKDSKALIRRVKPSYSFQSGFNAPQIMYHTTLMDHAARRSPLSVQFPCYNSLDPFHSTVLGMDATTSMNVIGNSVSSRISRITFLAEALAPPHTVAQTRYFRHEKYRQERLRDCVSSELLMCSSITHGFSGLAWFNGTLGDERSQYFVTKTLTAVRASLSKLDKKLNKSLVLSIYTLAFNELWNAFPEMWQRDSYIVRPVHLKACQTHLSALLVLIQQAGGWAAVGPYMLEGMLLMDKSAAVYEMKRPIIPLSWDPGPTPTELLTMSGHSIGDSQHLGSGFQGPGVRLKLSSILQDMATFTHFATSAWEQAAIGPGAENWLYLKLHTFYYRILGHEHETELEYMVKVASMIAQFNLLAYAGGELFAQVLLGFLQTALEHSWSTTFCGLNIDLQFWCLCTSALVKGKSAQKTWFVERLAGLVTEYSVTLELNAASLKLQMYLYVPGRQDPDLSALLTTLRTMKLL